jgi:hypothetical protein
LDTAVRATSDGTIVGKEGLPVKDFAMFWAYVMSACTRVGSLRATMERWSVLAIVAMGHYFDGVERDCLDERHGLVGDGFVVSGDFSFLVRGRTCVVVKRVVV